MIRYYNQYKLKILSKYRRFKINCWLKFKGVENYTINEDFTIDVNGDVDLRGIGCKKLPVQFGEVSGNFYCIGLGLKTLKGCPKKVGKTFECHHNKLKTLKYSPKEVGNHYCCHNSQLTSLKYCPEIIGGDFNCYNNELKNLHHAPSFVKGTFDCSNNESLKDIMDIHIKIEDCFYHETKNENDRIKLFDSLYEEAYHDPYAKTGLYYRLILDQTQLLKLQLKTKLEKKLASKNKCKVLKI